MVRHYVAESVLCYFPLYEHPTREVRGSYSHITEIKMEYILNIQESNLLVCEEKEKEKETQMHSLVERSSEFVLLQSRIYGFDLVVSHDSIAPKFRCCSQISCQQ